MGSSIGFRVGSPLQVRASWTRGHRTVVRKISLQILKFAHPFIMMWMVGFAIINSFCMFLKSYTRLWFVMGSSIRFEPASWTRGHRNGTGSGIVTRGAKSSHHEPTTIIPLYWTYRTCPKSTRRPSAMATSELENLLKIFRQNQEIRS